MKTRFYYWSRGSSPCPRKDCEGMVPCTIEGERDDINDWDGGTPGWEEFTARTCTDCGCSEWSDEEAEELKDNFVKTERDYDDC